MIFDYNLRFLSFYTETADDNKKSLFFNQKDKIDSVNEYFSL